jgi:hypothetical protein
MIKNLESYAEQVKPEWWQHEIAIVAWIAGACTLTYLITGTSDCPSFSFLGTSVTGGTSGVLPFYLISNYTPSISSYNFIQTNSAPIDVDQGIDSGYRDGKYFFGTTYSGTASFGSYTATQEH